eukprot:COSAG01_NODE_61831_length_287_cov_1.500000_1_plen_66_part_00
MWVSLALAADADIEDLGAVPVTILRIPTLAGFPSASSAVRSPAHTSRPDTDRLQCTPIGVISAVF